MWRAGRCTDLSFLDPIVREDTPAQAIRLAAGELALRIQAGRRRQLDGLGEGLLALIRQRRMHGKAGARCARCACFAPCPFTFA
jgi:hypothetical protein